MANTDVKLEPSEGTFVPSLQTVNVAGGDTITLHNNGGGPAFLFFSPDALRLLSLKPGGPPSIAGGGKAVFTFSSSAPGAYSVYFAASSDMAPPGFPTDVGPTFWLLAESWFFPVFQANPLTTGH
jgi:hypothetical protein